MARIRVLTQLVRTRRAETPRTPRPVSNGVTGDIAAAAAALGLTPLGGGGAPPPPARSVPPPHTTNGQGFAGINGHGPGASPASPEPATAAGDDIWAPIQKSISSLVFWGELPGPSRHRTVSSWYCGCSALLSRQCPAFDSGLDVVQARARPVLVAGPSAVGP